MKHYRLEFSEDKQWLRLDNYSHTPNIDGFITIMEKCTDTEYHIFEAFLTRSDGKLLRESKIKYRNVDVLEAVQELKIFIKSLSEYNLTIEKK